MSNKLYNIGAYGIPANIIDEVSKWELCLRWTQHARREFLNDKYGVLGWCPQTVWVTEGWQVVEVETNALGEPNKAVIRKVADGRRSLVLVVLRDGTVKTCWTNLNTDHHNTLDKSKFAKP